VITSEGGHATLAATCDREDRIIQHLRQWFGHVSVALTFDARGGVYIADGISPRIVDFMRRSQFRDRFEGKGRFQQYLKSIPVHVITHPAAAFIGLKSLLSARL
jgi:glucokinase